MNTRQRVWFAGAAVAVLAVAAYVNTLDGAWVWDDVSSVLLHHLFRAGEILGSMLNTIHNLHFYQTIMAEMRAAIEAGMLRDWAAAFAHDRSSGQ